MLSILSTISNRFITSFYSLSSFYSFSPFYITVFELSKIKGFHFKTRNLRATAEGIESMNTCLKNITIASFCSADTSEKVFVEDSELNVFEKIENEATTVDESSIIVNDLNTVVDSFEKRSDFFF